MSNDEFNELPFGTKSPDDGMALAHALSAVQRRHPGEPFSSLAIALMKIETEFIEAYKEFPWAQMETRRRVAERMFHLAMSNSSAPDGECERRFSRLCNLGFADIAQRSLYWNIYARNCVPCDEGIRLLGQLENMLENESAQIDSDLVMTRKNMAELSRAFSDPT